MNDSAPLYQRVLGDEFDHLCPAVKALHSTDRRLRAKGQCEIRRGKSWVAQLLATLGGLPPSGSDVPIEFSIDVADGREVWVRDFNGSRFVSVLSCKRGRLCERIGPLTLAFQLAVKDGTMSMAVTGGWLFGLLPLPRFVLPIVSTRESCAGGVYHFDVAADWPILGPVIRYTGLLSVGSDN